MNKLLEEKKLQELVTDKEKDEYIVDMLNKNLESKHLDRNKDIRELIAEVVKKRNTPKTQAEQGLENRSGSVGTQWHDMIVQIYNEKASYEKNQKYNLTNNKSRRQREKDRLTYNKKIKNFNEMASKYCENDCQEHIESFNRVLESEEWKDISERETLQGYLDELIYERDKIDPKKVEKEGTLTDLAQLYTAYLNDLKCKNVVYIEKDPTIWDKIKDKLNILLKKNKEEKKALPGSDADDPSENNNLHGDEPSNVKEFSGSLETYPPDEVMKNELARQNGDKNTKEDVAKNEQTNQID